MLFGVLGDVHGEFGALDAIMRRHPDVMFWLSVGDLASDDFRYPDPPQPLYWIQGNNEDFRAIHAGLSRDNLHFLPNGTCNLIGVRSETAAFFNPDGVRSAKEEKSGGFRPDPLRVAALGGTFAPTWYDTAAAALPYPGKPETGLARVRDDKRRHFVREQVDALKAVGHVDVLLTHEAPRPFIVQAGPRRLDAGKTAVNELLAALAPALHFFGHHHRFSDEMRRGVRSIGLDLITRSYVLVDRRTFDVTKIDYH